MVDKPKSYFGFITLLAIASVLPSSQVLYEKYRNDLYNTVDDLYCLTPQGASGKCLPIYECPESKKLIISNVKPKICAWIARVPIICCPTQWKIIKHTTSEPKRWTTGAPNTTSSSMSNNYYASQSTSRYSITTKRFTTTTKRFTTTTTTTTTTTPSTVASSTDFPETVAPIRAELPNRLPLAPETTSHSTLNVDEGEIDETRDRDEYQIPLCGTRIIKKNRYRIVGGTEAYPGEFPWSAAIFAKTLDGKLVQECGGTIISDRYILTAAHCFTTFNMNNYVIGVGNGLLWKTVKYEIKVIIPHPNYDPKFYYNDIALIETDDEIKFDLFTRPVCLPRGKSIRSGDEVSLAGWGYLKYDGRKSEVLNKVHLNVISRTFCNETYAKHRSIRIPLGINEHFLCAGAPDYSRDACEADSGGALLKRELAAFRMPLKEFEGRFVQVGVVSFGYKCAHQGYPGVYTDVAHFVHWIHENVNLRNSRSPPLL